MVEQLCRVVVALGCGLGIVPQVVLDNSVAGQRVNRIALDNIESYQLGLCCLRSRADEPVIKALFEQAANSQSANWSNGE